MIARRNGSEVTNVTKVGVRSKNYATNVTMNGVRDMNVKERIQGGIRCASNVDKAGNLVIVV